MYLYLVIAFQGFCIYHLLKNRNSYYWIFAILFLPFIGCVTYLVTQVFTKRDVQISANNGRVLKDTSKKALSSNKVKKLKADLEFTDTYLNRVNLADALLETNNYDEAIVHYLVALDDKTQNDFYVKSNLIKSYFYLNDYGQVIERSRGLKNHKDYDKSGIPFYLAMAYAENNRVEEALAQFEFVDFPYSNYNERLAYAKFLIHIEKPVLAKALLNELSEEIQNMIPANKQIYKATILDVDKLKSSL